MVKRFIYTHDGPGGTEEGYWEEEDEIYPLLRKFFKLMDIVEESDNGQEFHPNVISSCRAADGKYLSEIMTKMKRVIDEHDNGNI